MAFVGNQQSSRTPRPEISGAGRIHNHDNHIVVAKVPPVTVAQHPDSDRLWKVPTENGMPLDHEILRRDDDNNLASRT